MNMERWLKDRDAYSFLFGRGGHLTGLPGESMAYYNIYIYILYIMYIYIHIYMCIYYIYVCRSISIYIYIYHRYLYLSLCACTKSATFVEPVLVVCEASRLRTCRMSNSPPAALLGRCSPNDISKAFGIGVLPLNRLQC